MGGGRARPSARPRAARAPSLQARARLPRRSILFAAPVAVRRRKEPKSKYTADRKIPGAFEGETVTRRRFMTLHRERRRRRRRRGVRPARARLRASAPRCSTGRPSAGRPSARLDDFPDDTYVPKVITVTTGIGEVGKTTVYMRTRNDKIDNRRTRPATTSSSIAISTRCMHLGCPVRYVEAVPALHLPVPRRRLRLQGMVAGGPPVRPLDRFYTRVRDGRVEVGPRYSVNSRAQALHSYRDPAQDLDGIGQYLYPSPLLHSRS